MEESANGYEVILARQHISDVVRQNLPQIRAAFKELDTVAARSDGDDDVLMELVNSVADLLRGSLVKLFGVDVRPVNELGAFEDVDLDHTLTVFCQLVGLQLTQPPRADVVRGDWCEANRQQLIDQAKQLELELQNYRERLTDQWPADASEVFSGLERQVRLLRTGVKTVVPDDNNGRKSSGLA